MVGKKVKKSGNSRSSSKKSDDDEYVDKKYSKQEGVKNRDPKGRKMKKKNSLHQQDDDELRKAIEADGTKTIIEMAADGNCLFRSLSDQLYFDYGNSHDLVREDVVDYMEGHEDDFAVFLVMDEKDHGDEQDAADFETYCNDMRQDGEWGGNLELVAAAKMYRRNITVYSSNLAAFTIHHDSAKTSSGPDLLLSYHDNDHYNSVRTNNVSKKPPPPIKTFDKRNLAHVRSSRSKGPKSSNESMNESSLSDNSEHGDRHRHAAEDETSLTETDSSRQSIRTTSTSATEATAATSSTASTVTSSASTRTASTTGVSSSGESSISTINTNKTSKSSRSKASAASASSSSSRKSACPCGSGLRYQRCCRAKEKSEARLRKSGGAKTGKKEQLEAKVETQGNFRVLKI